MNVCACVTVCESVCVCVCVCVCERERESEREREREREKGKERDGFNSCRSLVHLMLSGHRCCTHQRSQLHTLTYSHKHMHTHTHGASECQSTAKPQAKSHYTGT